MRYNDTRFRACSGPAKSKGRHPCSCMEDVGSGVTDRRVSLLYFKELGLQNGNKLDPVIDSFDDNSLQTIFERDHWNITLCVSGAH